MPQGIKYQHYVTQSLYWFSPPHHTHLVPRSGLLNITFASKTICLPAFALVSALRDGEQVGEKG